MVDLIEFASLNSFSKACKACIVNHPRGSVWLSTLRGASVVLLGPSREHCFEVSIQIVLCERGRTTLCVYGVGHYHVERVRLSPSQTPTEKYG